MKETTASPYISIKIKVEGLFERNYGQPLPIRGEKTQIKTHAKSNEPIKSAIRRQATY
jgi:hypothetical protein